MKPSTWSGFFAIFSISLSASLFVGAACTKLLPHGGEKPTYPLVGRHAFVPCEGCHGPGTPQPESKVCIECHNQDRPSPNHNPGQNCGDAGCHTPDGWLYGVVDTGHTGGVTPHTGTPEHTGTPPDPIHDALAPDQLCWECHEVDRKDPLHYADPAQPAEHAWDCGPCHGTRDWATELFGHPCRTPHGSKSSPPLAPADWVVACADCHTGGNTAVTDCVTCHATIFPHYGVASAGDVGPTGTECTAACHPTGD